MDKACSPNPLCFCATHPLYSLPSNTGQLYERVLVQQEDDWVNGRHFLAWVHIGDVYATSLSSKTSWTVLHIQIMSWISAVYERWFVHDPHLKRPQPLCRLSVGSLPQSLSVIVHSWGAYNSLYVNCCACFDSSRLHPRLKNSFMPMLHSAVALPCHARLS